MLRTLSVRNFAIIDRLDLEFGAGFNVLTGETGAGKSIIMDALNLLLGGRAGAEMVRGGAERATIDAVFDVGGSPELQTLVAELGFDLEEDQLFVSREVAASGKSTCRLGGRPASVTQLKAVGEWLVDLHGQHEHQSLLAVARHLDMLDDWGGKPVQSLRAEVAAAFQKVQSLRREKDDLEKDARERAHLLDLYQFQVKEIGDARLTVGEDEELHTEHSRVANAQKLAEAALAAATALTGEDGGGILESLSTAARALEEAANLDPTLTPMLETLRSATYELTETERDLVRYQDEIEFDPERLEQIEERLETLRNLKRKYGDSIEEILAYGAETAAKVGTLSNSEERGAQLDVEIGKADKHLRELCVRLSAARAKAGKEFQSITLSELRELALEKARFEVHTTQGEPTAKGTDRVEFLITTNPGEPLRPLAKVASGGEISRVMLAVKAALARQEALPTMVFDEIDVGVGGRTSSVIADKMATLAKSAQILCITHLAQIASRGQHHYYIEKHVKGDRTVVTVTPLTPEQRISEIARMIGGAKLSETVLQHAREMLAVTS
ncbi:MAG: replication and repair protein RecN [Chthonomonadaceae bacterium]|nr:replication and repair protein RecN [Chthonomonadaceae bacterium]